MPRVYSWSTISLITSYDSMIESSIDWIIVVLISVAVVALINSSNQLLRSLGMTLTLTIRIHPQSSHKTSIYGYLAFWPSCKTTAYRVSNFEHCWFFFCKVDRHRHVLSMCYVYVGIAPPFKLVGSLRSNANSMILFVHGNTKMAMFSLKQKRFCPSIFIGQNQWSVLKITLPECIYLI